MSYPNYLDWRAMQRSLTDLALFRRQSMNLSSLGEESPPERIVGGVMTWNMMRIVGLKPVIGRDLTEAEDAPGGPKVALISEGLWKRRFGKSPKALGPQLIVDAVPAAEPAERERLREVAVALFDQLGQDDPIVSGYRRRLATALY